MNADFEDCLRRRRIWEFSRGKSLVEKELKTAEKDLVDGKEGLQREKYKWSTVQAYYSMFHSARALLYAKNYREKSHYCLIAALRALYVDKKLLPSSLIESLQNGKRLREQADYYDDWSKEGAESLLSTAEEFLSKAKALIITKS
jgi:uncharacterized protein (UPF0332 family)